MSETSPQPAARGRKRKAKSPAKRPSSRDHAGIAATFEEDVLAGRFPCGRLFRAAVERQRRDLADPPAGYVFRAELGERACRFMDLLPVSEGPNRGDPLVWAAWQVWVFRTFFGWVDSATGAPRFRFFSAWLPKGNGKSPLAAALALYITATARGGEKSFSAATTAKQARAVFGHAQEMLRLAPRLSEHFNLAVGEHAIKGRGDARCYEPVSAEAGSIEGIRPEGVVVLDEVHVLPDRKLFDNLKSAVSKCFAGRLATISTAGFDTSPLALAFQLYGRARDILLGKVQDPTTFALIAEADRKRPDGSDADPFSIDTIRQANPNLGVSVSLAGLAAAAQTAREVPSERASYEVKHLGWWQSTASVFIDTRRWAALGDRELRLDDVAGHVVYIGIDLAATRDLTAKVIVAVNIREDGKREYTFLTHAYLPEKSPTLTAHPELLRWADEGWITLTDGEVMDYGVLLRDVLRDLRACPNSEVCYDPWSAQPLANDLAAEGATVVEIRQGARTQSQPMRDFEAAILDGRARHDGSPVMEWCLGNLVARSDRNGNIAPDRESEHKKIDTAVAAINAMVRASVADGAGGAGMVLL